MNFIVICFLVIASFSSFPIKTYGEIIAEPEDPKVLSLTEHESPPVSDNCVSGGEVLQESEHEVLIRNERGAKNNNNNNNNNGSSSTGKKGKPNKKDKNINAQNQKQNNADTQPQTPEESACKYSKGPWTECDPKTNARSRTLNLKKGDASCVQTRTIQKKCKKACRYEKGAWTECTGAGGQMQRTDKLKTTTDASCQETRTVNKNCNNGKSKDKKTKEERKTKNGNKDKGRKNRQ